MDHWVGIVCWGVSAAFNSALAYLLHRVVRGDRPAANAAGYAFLWIFVTTLSTLIPGLLGWLSPLPIGLVSLSGLCLLLVFPGARKSLWQGWLEIRDGHGAVRAWWRSLPKWLRWLTAIWAAVSAVRFAFLIVVLPPFVWDSLTYHLTNVAHWVQAGRIELFSTPVVRIYSAANFEVLAAWFAVFLHHDLVVEAAGLPAYGLGLLAVYALGRNLEFSRAASWLAALTYACTPALLLATTGTKNDPHMAAYFLTALAILAGLSRPEGGRSSANPSGQLVLLGIVFLTALGTKAYMLHLTLGLVVFGLAFGLWRHAPGVWFARCQSAWFHLKDSTRTRQVILAGILVAGVFLGGYWNTRNWLLTGNPVYPYGVAIGGSQVLPSGDRTARLNLDRLSGNLESLLDKFGDRNATVSPDLSGTTGWGWFAYGLGLPSLIWCLVRRERLRWLAVGFAASLIFIFLSDRPSPWNMRYVIWFPALFSLAFAEWIDSGWMEERRLATATAALLTVALGLNALMTFNYGAIRPGQFQQMLERSVWDRQSATLKVNMPAEYENAIVYVPNDALLGYNVSSNGFVYPLYRADFSQRIVYVPFNADDTCQMVIEAMQAQGTRYLFVAPEHTPDDRIARLQACSQDPDSGLRQRARGLYVIKTGS